MQKLGETLNQHFELAKYLHNLQLSHVQNIGSQAVEHAKQGKNHPRSKQKNNFHHSQIEKINFLVAKKHKEIVQEEQSALEEAIQMDQTIAEQLKKVNLNIRSLKAHCENKKAEIVVQRKKNEESDMQATMEDLCVSKQELAEALRTAHIEMVRYVSHFFEIFFPRIF
jgi:sulfur relay (sulfurtransferase) DsrC/TusE family protein